MQIQRLYTNAGVRACLRVCVFDNLQTSIQNGATRHIAKLLFRGHGPGYLEGKQLTYILDPPVVRSAVAI